MDCTERITPKKTIRAVSLNISRRCRPTRTAPNWAGQASTPVRTGKDFAEFGPWTTQVKERNNIADAYVRRAGIPIDDLYALILDHPEFYAGADGVHLNAEGKAAEARSVADAILQMLPK